MEEPVDIFTDHDIQAIKRWLHILLFSSEGKIAPQSSTNINYKILDEKIKELEGFPKDTQSKTRHEILLAILKTLNFIIAEYESREKTYKAKKEITETIAAIAGKDFARVTG